MSACSGDFDPGSRVTKLRLLAVQAEPAWAKPGAEVKLDSLWLDPAGRSLSWGWATCVDPASAGVQDCIDSLPKPIVLTPGGPTFSFRVPDDTISRLPAAGREGAVVGVLVVVCPGTIVSADTQGVPIGCVRDGRALRLDEFEIGVKRVFVRENESNTNPPLSGMTFDGTPWAEDEIREVTACDTGGNRFNECDESLAHSLAAQGAQAESDEQVVIEYYATEGIFEHDVRIPSAPETRWVARASARGSTVTLFAVVRDSRGGVRWTTRKIRVM